MTATRLLLAALAALAPAPPTRAVIIGDFKSLGDLLDKSSLVIVGRIEKNADPNEGPDLCSTHDVYVLSALKGGIPKGATLRLRLMDTSEHHPKPWAVGSLHLLFLAKDDAGGKWSHRSLGIKGSNLPVSPLTRDEVVKGLSAKEAAKALLREYAEWREKQRAKEKEFLDKVLGGK
ncbi:MAG: hypothetical protein K2W96_12450 [Gemmataceae bacterium]|nr:hypothetical protein [Gemmataceae bacterium]